MSLYKHLSTEDKAKFDYWEDRIEQLEHDYRDKKIEFEEYRRLLSVYINKRDNLLLRKDTSKNTSIYRKKNLFFHLQKFAIFAKRCS